MAPSSVLLDREVSFVRSGPAVAGIAGSWRRDYDEILAATLEDLKTMKPHLDIADPPRVSRLSMVRRMDNKDIPCGGVSCTDKALVLLYAGLPGSHMGYLVYDAFTNSNSWIPSLPDSLNCLFGAAVLTIEDDAYILAELGLCDLEDAVPVLYLWPSTSDPNVDWWLRSAAQIPSELFTPSYSFNIDMVFTNGSSSVCWVDLLQGVLICNLLEAESKFNFVPLPFGHTIDIPTEPREGSPVGRPHPQEFRTMGCVGGVINFVSLVGYYEIHSHNDMVLKTWSLSCDHKKWELCKALGVPDLWASKSFRESNLPQLTPSFPMLSMDDPEIINFTLNDVDYDDKGRMLLKGQHMVSLNTMKNMVISARKLNPESPRPQFPDLIPSEFSAWLKGPHKASKAGASKAGSRKAGASKGWNRSKGRNK